MPVVVSVIVSAASSYSSVGAPSKASLVPDRTMKLPSSVGIAISSKVSEAAPI